MYADKKTAFKFDPYYLFFREGFWYVRGYYHPEKAVRTLALDRIISLRILHEHFVQRILLRKMNWPPLSVHTLTANRLK